MPEALVYGWRTAILSVAVAQLLLLAAGLSRTLQNRAANRTLAALLVVLAGVVTPWMIGFAGFYDRWQWLTFAPFAITLAVAPLLYLYVHALVTGGWPARGWRHLLPAAAQFVFFAASFLLPWPLKDRWSEVALDPVNTATALGTVLGLALYGTAALRLLGRYRTLLAAQRSDDHRFAAAWASRAIGASFVLLALWAAYTLWDTIAPLGYRGLMGLYAGIAAVALYLGIEGWRHAALPFPRMADLAIEDLPAAAPRDWAATGKAWEAEIRAAGWHRDPELTLAALARRLGTNNSYLSRALNEGLGMNFSTFVNRLRCESVAEAIRAGRGEDLLGLALDAGFSSKASFNRAFLAIFGTTPSAYRARVSKPE
jgi:AraC-like DNA-binding protein